MTRPELYPRAAAYLIAAAFALAIGHDLMRKPIQVSDSLQELIDVQQSPSLADTFAAHSPRAPFLRPLRQVQIKALFDAAGGHYQRAFRGFHALLLALALFLFVRALRVRTWAHFAAAVFALTVLTGLHTFRGLVREAFPINHFLEIVVFCLLTLNLAQSRGGWWIDLAAAVTFVAAGLTLESGPLVWVVAVAAWMSGLRGISGRGVAAMSLLLGGYFWIRFVTLDLGTPGFDVGRDSGFGTRLLAPDEIVERFGDNPAWFYVYNVAASILSVLLSDPDRGVFHTVRTWQEGTFPARLYIAVIPSLLTTALIAWVAAARLHGGAWRRPEDGDRLLFVAAAVLVANAVFSYVYTKHEIISVAGAFYACAAYVAVRHVIERGSGGLKASGYVLCVYLAVLAGAWAVRSAGVHHMLQTQAFRERLEWARLDPERIAERGYPSDDRSRALTRQLRREALDLRLPNPSALPAWADDLWGE